MRFQGRLKDQFEFAGFQFFAPSGFGRFPGIAQAGDFAAVERQAHVGGAFVAGNQLDRQAERHLEHVGNIVRTGA